MADPGEDNDDVRVQRGIQSIEVGGRLLLALAGSRAARWR